MKIKALIEELQKYPEDMEVLVDGYEGDYDDIAYIHERTVKKQESPDYIGEFGDAEFVENDNPTIAAIILARKSF